MKKDYNIIRNLAEKVREIANHPIQKEKEEIWKKYNKLERIRPLVLIFPEGSWREILPEKQLLCEDEYF
ncbi:MAG: hypothetical protein N2589_00105, partial [bacterium]|nr:hypothetical protein [bacterium]